MRGLARKAAVAGVVLATALVAAAQQPARDTALVTAVRELPAVEERAEGYQREAFPHWRDEDGNGCNTRAEVLLEEAVEAPEVSGRCSLAGGRWVSYYDDAAVHEASKLDIDHVVPLAEAWQSGAWDWPAQRRQRYANDLAQKRSLVAVTAHSNRSKGAKDVTEWLPASGSATCRYVADWVTVKRRWGLSADSAERRTLMRLARSECSDKRISTSIAP